MKSKKLFLIGTSLVLSLTNLSAQVEFGVDIPNATAASSYVALAGSDGATATNNGVTFTLNSANFPAGATRTRNGVTLVPVDLHEDFVFADAGSVSTTITLTLSGLTPGQEYTINSVHFEGNALFPARMSVSLKDDNGGTVAGPQIIDNNPSSTGSVDNISTTNFVFTAQPATNYVLESVALENTVEDPTGGQSGLRTRNRLNALLVTEGPTSTLDISDFSKNDISGLVSSANPVASTIELNAEGSYSITNIGGQTIQSGTFNGSINVENLTTGLYFLSIDGGTYKFAKE